MSDAHQHPALHDQFRWLVPARFNIADVCCNQWALSGADARRIALYTEASDGTRDIWTYQRLYEASGRLARALQRMDVQRGDRVAVVLPARAEAVVSHLAVLQLGAVSVPLPAISTSNWLQRVLHHCKCKVAIVDAVAASALVASMPHCPALQQVIGVDFNNEHCIPWRSLLVRQDAVHVQSDLRASDPALLLYPGGGHEAKLPGGATVVAAQPPVTGSRGRRAARLPVAGAHAQAAAAGLADLSPVLLSHASLAGMLPGFVAAFDGFPRGRDVVWTGADWATADGLLGSVLPALYFGRSIVAANADQPVVEISDLLSRYRVTHALLPAHKVQVFRDLGLPRLQALDLLSVALVGATASEEVMAWCHHTFGVAPNPVFSMPQTGFILGGSRQRWSYRPGSMGLPYPGHKVAVVNADGKVVAPGESGVVALHEADRHGHPDPALFLGYWQGHGNVQRPLVNGWFCTGQRARTDEDGYFWPSVEAPSEGQGLMAQVAPLGSLDPRYMAASSAAPGTKERSA